MSCSHAEVVSRYKDAIDRPAHQRPAEFRCTCGASINWADARALHFAQIEKQKHNRRDAGGVYPGDLDELRRRASRWPGQR